MCVYVWWPNVCGCVWGGSVCVCVCVAAQCVCVAGTRPTSLWVVLQAPSREQLTSASASREQPGICKVNNVVFMFPGCKQSATFVVTVYHFRTVSDGLCSS